MFAPWPHQPDGVSRTIGAIARGIRRACLTSPTGGGKSWMMTELASHYARQGRKVSVYTNRKLLVEQLSATFTKFGIDHGVRSAGYTEDKHHDVQISSIQTENARVNKKKTWKLHEAHLVIVDEAHIQTGPVVTKILEDHLIEPRCAIVGVTATPLDLGGMYDELIVAGNNSSLRACGALVPAIHVGADEPDLRAMKIKQIDGKDFSESQQRKAIMTPTIFGRVLHHFQKLNPSHKPSILFAPGVGESLWFAEQFVAAGITAAHIGDRSVWMNGEEIPTGTPEKEMEAKAKLLDASRKGVVKVLCNRFILREGVDAPWIEHLVLATIFGTLQTYLQVGGRGLRSCPGKTRCVIQDHGGNWWRFGSLNSDRHWDLRYTNGIIAAIRADRLRSKKCRKCEWPLGTLGTCDKCGFYNEREPYQCPGCGKIQNKPSCDCGHAFGPKRSRPVVQVDGELRVMTGDIFKPLRICAKPNGAKLWERMYWRSRTKLIQKADGTEGVVGVDRTFRSAFNLFARENNWGYPNPEWPLMPTRELDKYLLVRDVPMETLR